MLFLQEMADDAVWGETLEIMAAAAAFGVNVSVHVGLRRVGDNVVQDAIANHYLCGTVEQRRADGLPPVVHGRIYLHSTDGLHFQWKRPRVPASAAPPNPPPAPEPLPTLAELQQVCRMHDVVNPHALLPIFKFVEILKSDASCRGRRRW